MHWLVASLLAFTLTVAACASDRQPSTNEPRRKLFGPVLPINYQIWYDQEGWHLRVATFGKTRRFHGTIRPLGGSIVDVRPTLLELKDRIKVGPNGVEFEFVSQRSGDGFDWHVSSGCNRFEIFINDDASPYLFLLGEPGGPQSSPRQVPFELCP